MNLLFKDFFLYLSNPSIVEPKKFNVRNFLILIILNFLLSFLLAFIIRFIYQKLDINQKDFNVTPFLIFWIIFIAPIFEEIFCRLNLRLSKINYLILLISLAVVVIIMSFRHKYDSCILYGIALFSLIIIYMFFKNKGKQFYLKHFKYVFWASCLLFGLLHIMNLTGNWVWIITLAPILCFPQFIGGAIVGYIRMNYGFIYGVIFHMLINSVVLFSLIPQK